MKTDECRVCAVIRGEQDDGKEVYCAECQSNKRLMDEFDFRRHQWTIIRTVSALFVLYTAVIVFGALTHAFYFLVLVINLGIWAWQLFWFKKMLAQFVGVKERLFVLKVAGEKQLGG
jgi:hypothetical protein